MTIGQRDTGERYSDRCKLRLVEHGTIGDGKVLCCSVETVVTMLQDCEELAYCDGAMAMMEFLASHPLPAETLKAGLAHIRELEAQAKEKLRQRRA